MIYKYVVTSYREENTTIDGFGNFVKSLGKRRIPNSHKHINQSH